ncbi:hypothetical protein IWQ61_004061 [Dispira simplex]|nr:hypothetical protein IWQ61_004061 [Dispira simplex]
MSYIPFGSRSSKLSDLVRKSNLLWEPAQVNRDHCTLRGFIVRAKSLVPPKNGPVVIYFQGNAGNVIHREPVFQRIVQAVPTVTIVAIHTSGYGNSQGTATERNLRADAYSIFQFVRERYPPTLYPIYIYGHSLGGALAIDLANRLTTQSKPGNMPMVCGVVLENTFTSMLDLVGAVYPRWLPYYWLARYCLWNHWPNVDRIQAITVPILFLSAAKDDLVPPWMMTKLSQKAKRPQWVAFPLALHDNLYQQPDL